MTRDWDLMDVILAWREDELTITELHEAIVKALAKERERARKPFLKLAHRYGEEGADSMRQGAGVYSQIAREIRRAAEESP